MIDQEPWTDRAACRGVENPDLFFPERGSSVHAAKKICQFCQVRTECLEYALAHDERFGVWGGLPEYQRRKIRQGTASKNLCAAGHLLAEVGVDARGRCYQCQRDDKRQKHSQRRADIGRAS